MAPHVVTLSVFEPLSEEMTKHKIHQTPKSTANTCCHNLPPGKIQNAGTLYGQYSMCTLILYIIINELPFTLWSSEIDAAPKKKKAATVSRTSCIFPSD